MVSWYTLCRWEAEAKAALIQNEKSDRVKQHEQLSNRKAFINKKHNLTTGKSYVHKRRS